MRKQAWLVPVGHESRAAPARRLGASLQAAAQGFKNTDGAASTNRGDTCGHERPRCSLYCLLTCRRVFFLNGRDTGTSTTIDNMSPGETTNKQGKRGWNPRGGWQVHGR